MSLCWVKDGTPRQWNFYKSGIDPTSVNIPGSGCGRPEWVLNYGEYPRFFNTRAINLTDRDGVPDIKIILQACAHQGEVGKFAFAKGFLLGGNVIEIPPFCQFFSSVIAG